MKKYKSLILNEKIFGLNAFVYHRTRPEALDEIISKGFIPGGGSMYGRGLYSTYNVESQLIPSMEENYGKLLIKFKVNLYGCLILDYDQSKLIFGKEYTLYDQCKKFFKPKNLHGIIKNLLKKPQYVKVLCKNNEAFFGQLLFVKKDVFSMEDINLKEVKIIKISDVIDIKDDYGNSFVFSSDEETIIQSSEALKKYKFSSDDASSLLAMDIIRKNIKGLVFTGRTDGKVCVIYNTEIAIPVAYTITEMGEFVYKDVENNSLVIFNQKQHRGQRQKYLDSGKWEVKRATDSDSWEKVVSLQNIKKSIAKLSSIQTQSSNIPDDLYYCTDNSQSAETVLNDLISSNELSITKLYDSTKKFGSLRIKIYFTRQGIRKLNPILTDTNDYYAENSVKNADSIISKIEVTQDFLDRFFYNLDLTDVDIIKKFNIKIVETIK